MPLTLLALLIAAEPTTTSSGFRIDAYTVDAVLTTTTRAASSGLNTDPFPEVGVRGGARMMLTPLWIGRLVASAEALGLVGQDTAGTRAVRVARTWLGAGGRGALGYEVGGRRFAATPFGFVEAGVGAGAGAAKVLNQVRYSPTLRHWGRGGVGFVLDLWSLRFSLDLGLGWSELRTALSSQAGIGMSF